MQNAANNHYDRSSACEFTTFIAYENTSMPAGVTQHRNVIFRNDDVIDSPITAIDISRVANPDPEFQITPPWLVAGGFGLLHGLGFAGALREVGLPEGDIPLALVSFNVGIELGQLFFVALILLAWAALRMLPFVWPSWTRWVPAYAIGSLAAYWFFERLSQFLA